MAETEQTTGTFDLSSRRSRIVEKARTDIESLVSSSLSEIAELEEEAEQRERRYHSAVAELSAVREELTEARKEHGSLPLAAYEQNLKGDALKEEELRGRYLQLEERIPTLETRERELAAECDKLCSGSARALPAVGVYLQQHRDAMSAAKSYRQEAEKLRDELYEVAEEAIQPLLDRHDKMRTHAQASRATDAFRQTGYADAQSVPGH